MKGETSLKTFQGVHAASAEGSCQQFVALWVCSLVTLNLSRALSALPGHGLSQTNAHMTLYFLEISAVCSIDATSGSGAGH